MKWNKNYYSTLIPVVSLLSSLRQKSRSKKFVLKPWILLLPIHPVRTLTHHNRAKHRRSTAKTSGSRLSPSVDLLIIDSVVACSCGTPGAYRQ